MSNITFKFNERNRVKELFDRFCNLFIKIEEYPLLDIDKNKFIRIRRLFGIFRIEYYLVIKGNKI